MLKSFKVHCFLSDPNYLIEINLCKNLFSLGFAWTWFWCKFGQNMQGFKFEKKKKKLWRTKCFSRHMTTSTFWLNINKIEWIKWKRFLFFLIFSWIYFWWIFQEPYFANLIKFQKTQKISSCKKLSKWNICLNAIHDTLFKVLISSLYSSDSLTASFSTAWQNS